MLTLKGYSGKSTIISILMESTNSICFVYNDYPVLYNSICVDSKVYSLNDFLKCITEWFQESLINDKHYDYLLIYTNQDEEELKEIAIWEDNNRRLIPCRDIILTCK